MHKLRNLVVILASLSVVVVAACFAWHYRPRDPADAARETLAAVRHGKPSFGSELSAVANGDHPAVRNLAGLGPAAVPVLIQAVADRDYDVRVCAAWGLSYYDDPAVVPPLLRFAAKDHQTGQLHRLMYRKNPAVVDAMIDGLASPDARICEAAGGALAAIQEKRAVPGLCALIRRDPNSPAAASAIEALDEIGDASAGDALNGALSGEYRQSAAFALGNLRDPRAVGPLLEMARDADHPRLNVLAFRSLGRVGDAKAVPSLQVALQSADRDIRSAAAEALAKIRIHELSSRQPLGVSP
jgi:HEAT repeat protein